MIFNSTRFGHDISTYQDDPAILGSVNFNKMVSNGASFVILRSTVGNLYDTDFQTYKQNSRGKLPRGVYHYYWNTVSPITQAQLCLSAIGNEKFEGRVWLDLETITAGAYAGGANWKRFMEIILAAGLRVGIYTGYYHWKTYAVDKGADIHYFAQFPLWQAWYTNYANDVLVAQPWSSMMIWQYTSTGGGYAAGAESPNIDHNKWNDAYNFSSEWQTAPLPPQETHTMKYTATALGDATRLRPMSNVNQTYLASYPAGTKFNGDVLFIAAPPLVVNQVAGDTWLQVTEIVTPSGTIVKAGWVAIIHQGKAVCSLVENVVTPPPALAHTLDVTLDNVVVFHKDFN